jgi:hypothetical protein
MTIFDLTRAHALRQQPAAQRWLIEDLWADEAVGIVGGEPKCYKSFLVLSMAVSVAAGVPCLGRFPAAQTGPVLLFAAEDALHVVRTRLHGICLSAQVAFDRLDVHVITEPVVRLDAAADRLRLRESIEHVRPRLLILDPFVRLHRIDENAAAEVAPLLAYLRELQRSLHCAVALVHHARKGGHARAGQALRGSSELHAWGDSNLYLRRQGERLLLSTEHRAAASSATGLDLALSERGGGLALHVCQDMPVSPEKPPPSPSERVLDALSGATAGLTRRELRDTCHIRNTTLGETLTTLHAAGRVRLEAGRVQLALL